MKFNDISQDNKANSPIAEYKNVINGLGKNPRISNAKIN